jgi:hypothetical protein
LKFQILRVFPQKSEWRTNEKSDFSWKKNYESAKWI